MKIYIAGAISGDPHYKEKFAKAESDTRELMGEEIIVLNPAILPEGMSEKDYMQITMAMLNAADFAVFLDDFTSSTGAKIEYEYCLKTGIPCGMLSKIYYDTFGHWR